MMQACKAAQDSFKFFWRELSWERRRIVPGLDMTMVKLPFTDGARNDGNPEYEHMWVGDVDFDGESITGNLLNSPNWLTSVQAGQSVTMPFTHLEDWMMTADGRAYGGYTVNLMRAGMNARDRKNHDDAWGLDFGDPSDVKVEVERQPKQKPKGGFLSGLFGSGSKEPAVPSAFHDHPMCINMLPKVEAQLQSDVTIASSVDDMGWTLLHREALAGNLGIVKLLVQHGANVDARTPSGRNAAYLARSIGWQEVADSIEQGQ
ncbi:uncharacterized protein YegJ (DUF2314 family) [Roseimicrobium gellanilyticum]|uniref:Uncharacterized protein YegJ (DUF2314 family) n=2 Tax=Roseimicrobium gellanilyticum TaxID=748857 RepID=A0A366HST1_9BACT|nr:uncharacterized protein YegJ (DUF2314 family) [Roseimicrobium gellanilyticum]